MARMKREAIGCRRCRSLGCASVLMGNLRAARLAAVFDWKVIRRPASQMCRGLRI